MSSLPSIKIFAQFLSILVLPNMFTIHQALFTPSQLFPPNAQKVAIHPPPSAPPSLSIEN